MKIVRLIIGRGGAYFILVAFAAAMLFPFGYMVATALKTPDDTFRYPPKILPRSAVTTIVDGVEADLYSLDVPGTGATTVYLAENGWQNQKRGVLFSRKYQ